MESYRGPRIPRRSPPPRDRPPMRDRDNHPDVEYFGKGESYRPGGSTGEGPYRPSRERPTLDTWNSDRRDDRRDDRRRDDIDSYIPPTSSRAQRPRSRSPAEYRRRSRSPPYAARGRESREDLFPDSSRPRSPPSRRFSPRRDERNRSPIRRRSRSPPYSGRGRSPDGKRMRDFTPDSRRSPKRERFSSPRGRYDGARSPPRRAFSPRRESDRNSYRPRSRSPPPRDDRRGAYADDNWRRRSPSPRASGPGSNATSRRSSPPYQDRPAPMSHPRSPPYSSRNDSSYRGRSPRRDYDRSRDPSPPPPVVDREMSEPTATVAPTGPASYRNGSYERAPPTGPGRVYNPPNSTSPPSGPAASQPSMSAHNRGPVPSGMAVPTRPRAAVTGRFDGPPRDFPPSPLRGRSSLTYRAPGLRTTSYNADTTPSAGPPSGPPAGPRASFSGPPPSRGDFGSGRGGYGTYGNHSTSFRGSSNSTSTTYPRTQRFNTTTSPSPVTPTGPASMSMSLSHPTISPHTATPISSTDRHLSTLAQVVPGGKKLPSGLPADQERRLKTLELEAERMRKEIEDKQRLKRRAVNDWEILERQSEIEGLKSELAEGALRKLMENSDGEGATGMAF